MFVLSENSYIFSVSIVHHIKNILLILMLTAACVFGQSYTNGVYVRDGKTVEVDKRVHQITPTNKAEVLHFSNGLIAKILENGDFIINSFFQEVSNLNVPAQKAKFGVHNLSSTLMSGKAIFVYSNTNENSSCVVSTPMVDVAFNTGLFYVEVTDKKVIVACLDGSFRLFNGKKESTFKTGQAVIAEPNEVGILEDKVAVSPGKVNTESLKRLTTNAKEVAQIQGKILFAVVNDKLVGILID